MSGSWFPLLYGGTEGLGRATAMPTSGEAGLSAWWSLRSSACATLDTRAALCFFDRAERSFKVLTTPLVASARGPFFRDSDGFAALVSFLVVDDFGAVIARESIIARMRSERRVAFGLLNRIRSAAAAARVRTPAAIACVMFCGCSGKGFQGQLEIVWVGESLVFPKSRLLVTDVSQTTSFTH